MGLFRVVIVYVWPRDVDMYLDGLQPPVAIPHFHHDKVLRKNEGEILSLTRDPDLLQMCPFLSSQIKQQH